MMEDRIKSAIEIAMEKAAQLGNLTPEEERRMKWVPEGERLVARYLDGEGDLAEALRSVDRSSVSYALRGALAILLRKLVLPRDKAAIVLNRRILDALRVLCQDRKTLDVLVKRVGYVEEQYTNYGRQQLETSYEALKQQVTSQIQQRLRQQGMVGTAHVNVESMPEFQSQLMAMVAKLEQPYEQNLEGLREQLRELVLAKPAFR